MGANWESIKPMDRPGIAETDTHTTPQVWEGEGKEVEEEEEEEEGGANATATCGDLTGVVSAAQIVG